MRQQAFPRFGRMAAALLCAAVLAVACDSPTQSDDGPEVAARLDLVSGDLQTAEVGTELPQPLVVKVTSAKGKPVAGQVVNFRVVSGGGSVFVGATQTNADGLAQERWTLGTVARDTQRVEIRAADPATGQPLVFGTFRAVGRAGPPAGISPVGPAARTGSAGSALGEALQARVSDRYGNPVPAATVVWTVRSGGGSVTPGTATADSMGIAGAVWTLGPRLDSAQVVEAAAAVAVKTAFTATAALPLGSAVVKVSGDGQTATAGAPLAQPLKVAVLLPGGQPAVGATVNWSVAPGAGTLTPLVSLTDANGQATAQWTLGAGTGAQSASASVAGAGTATFTATATPGAPAQAAPYGPSATSGDTLVAGVAGAVVEDSFAVIVRDAAGNPVPGAQVAWSVTGGGGSITTPTTTDAAGVARTQWVLGASTAPQTAQATVGTSTVRFTAYPATALTRTSGDGVTAGTGSTLTVTLSATGASGAIGGLPIHWAVTSGGGSVTPALGETSRHAFNLGTASAAWTLGASPGTQTLTASAGGLSVTFTATAIAAGTRTLLAQLPGRAVDATTDRVLWVEPQAGGSVKLRTLGTGTDVALTTDPDPRYTTGYLFSAGVIFRTGGSGLFEYRGGVTTPLGGAFGYLAAEGEWAAWSSSNQVIRRDLATGTNLVLFSARGFYEDVGPNGDVTFTTDSPRLYHDGTLTPISCNAIQIQTDGVNVVCTGGTLVLERGNDDVPLAQGWSAYRLDAGWIAWSTSGPVQRRTPAGVVQQVSPESGALLDALGPDGTVVYRYPRNGGRYYLVTPAGARYDLGPATDIDQVVVHGSDFFLLSNGSAYRLGP